MMVEILVKTMKPVALLLLFFTLAAVAFGQAGPPGNTKNVILITLDGARTQEVFGGLDLEVLKSKTKKGGVEETPLYKKYYAETPEERREKLTEETDDLLDEIDDVLEENAEDFVRAYVQKGGQ